MIFTDSAHIPIKPPQDPFHPRADETFWFIEPDFRPIQAPEYTGNALSLVLRIFLNFLSIIHAIYPMHKSPHIHPALDSEGQRVILKAVCSSSKQLKVIQCLSTDPLQADAQNHTIPVLEILSLGDWAVVVTAEWGFDHWSPCASVKDYLEFSQQLFEVWSFALLFLIYTGLTSPAK